MPWYTADELHKMMDPKMEQDKLLMERCIAGISVYAAQWAYQNPASPIISEMRDLVVSIASYWGLDEGSDDVLRNKYLDQFDMLVENGCSGIELILAINQNCGAAILGLYRFGTEMVSCQGIEAKSPILDHAVEHLENSVRMLEKLDPRQEDLPGIEM